MAYEINVRVKVSHFSGVIDCGFWFTNPVTKENSLIIERKRGGESNMDFVKRIKTYINSKVIVKKIKEKILEDVQEYDKKNKLNMDLNDVKAELDGLTFSVKVDMK